MSDGSPRSTEGTDDSNRSEIWEIIRTLRTHETMIDNIMLTMGKTETAHAVLEEKIDEISETVKSIQHFLVRAGRPSSH